MGYILHPLGSCWGHLGGSFGKRLAEKGESQGIYSLVSLRGCLYLAEPLDQNSFQGTDSIDLSPLLGLVTFSTWVPPA